MTDFVYFDNSATTRMCEEALNEYDRIITHNLSNVKRQREIMQNSTQKGA